RLRALSRLDADAAIAQLSSAAPGLQPDEAARRLRNYGRNDVATIERQSLAGELLSRSVNPLNALLLSLAAVSYYLGEQRASAMIVTMVLLSVGLGFVQEHRSNKTADALRRMVRTTATVRRGGAAGHLEVPMEEVVPGDIVLLSAGDMVPADLRLVSAKDLFVNQSSLTGEAMPVEKFAHAVEDAADSAFDLQNMCFAGTSVLSGIGCGVVALTGQHTTFGHVAGMLAARRAPTSFDKGIARFTWMMIGLIAVMVPLVFIINGLTKGDWFEALLFAVAVAVGLTPEMLPMIVTVNLAKGAIEMARRRVIVKRLDSIQNFGAMDVLCTDKTGTLTQDRIILKRHLDVHGDESTRVLKYAYLNSLHQSGLKNLLDVAVLSHVELEERIGMAGTYDKIDEVPFDFERRRMSVVLSDENGKRLLICKGAVEEVFSVCTRYATDAGEGPLDATHFADAQRTTTQLNADGFRVVAVACKTLPQESRAYTAADEQDMTLAGYIAFLDPPKETCAPALAALSASGVCVKILTGDNDIVTRKVCHEVGLSVDRIVIGKELESMAPETLEALAESAVVFAKVSPAQKAAIIEALRRRGHVVGFLGDGINDGPALHAADVGVSVDSAVDIAKESADIILLEKSLGVLNEGVLEGRKVFGNITKYIKMGASSNFGNMFSVLGASAFL
ncbi:MAG TPA: magnesium-translocating P-type ATPase, partial [Tepidisphaeraceae bacterium]|nr:magnesium-translocating P-type ATPase [Tepidisphaeraceae bacterium]